MEEKWLIKEDRKNERKKEGKKERKKGRMKERKKEYYVALCILNVIIRERCRTPKNRRRTSS